MAFAFDQWLLRCPLSQPAYLGIRFHFPCPGLRPLAGGSWSSWIGWGRGVPCQPPAPRAGPKGPSWEGSPAPVPAHGGTGTSVVPFLACCAPSEGLWHLGLHRSGLPASPLFPCLFSSPLGWSCMFQGCQQTAREDEFLLLRKVFMVKSRKHSPATPTLRSPSPQETASSSQLSLFLASLCSLESHLDCQERKR